MNIAVLSDIHGNYVALQECIDYALRKAIDTFIFLGDYVGEFAYPQRTMELIYRLNEQYRCFFVKGNKEDYWLKYQANGEQGWKEIDSTTGSLWYTYHHLTEKDLQFFNYLSIRQELVIDHMPPIVICHGSPRQVNEKMLPDNERTYEAIEQENASVILCGHTHIQSEIEHNGKKVYNPGAVGVPLYSDGRGQFMILHGTDAGWTREFVSLSYDRKKVIEELHEAGLDRKAPCWCRVTENLLLYGTVSHGKVLNKAMELCRQACGNCNWPDIPEKYWKLAVEEMI